MTYSLPSGRDTPDELHRKSVVVQRIPLLKEALDGIPSMVVILNENRQIVAANEALLTILDTTLAQVAQKRPGEAFNCIRAEEGPDGCGTALHCVTCGVLNAILQSQSETRRVVQECRILVDTPNGTSPLDLKATASVFRVDKDLFVMVALEDISHSKKLDTLQRTFFHDILNMAGCVHGYAEYLVNEGPDDTLVFGRLAEISAELLEAIEVHRDRTYAEMGDLRVEPKVIHTRALLDKLRLQYLKHPVAADRLIQLGEVWEGALSIDERLLKRVLGNMVKNALEATDPGGIVSLGCEEDCGNIVFSVHNAEVMPEEVQLQVFQRSFSTKGQSGRGIGTYSMKLFGERYLGGKVHFVSQAPEGTTFMLTIPKNLANNAQ